MSFTLSRDRAEPSTVSAADCSELFFVDIPVQLLYQTPLISLWRLSLFLLPQQNLIGPARTNYFQELIISQIMNVSNIKYRGIPIEEIVIYKHPLTYLSLLSAVLLDMLVWIKDFIIRNFILIISLVVVAALIATIQFLHPVFAFIVFALYWILLGVASSIGLGTGLHTFVLYLGPHIAKVAMVATSCGYLPEMLPSRWEFDHFGKCEGTPAEPIGFFGILMSVQLEAFLWGLGTALGELPPYFVAKKAADTRDELMKMELEVAAKQANSEEKKKLLETAEEINEIHKLRAQENKTLMDKAKILIYDNMEKYGFITILLCASIPNPLFDLAGITCGHFRIPFRKFFSATFIGKAIIKVHIQMLFVITVFRKETVNVILTFLAKFNQGLSETIASVMEKQREQLYHPSEEGDKPLIGRLWDIFIILMVGYFLLSIVNSEVQGKAVKRQDKEP